MASDLLESVDQLVQRHALDENDSRVQCAFCKEPYHPKSRRAVELPCKHLLCECCLREWLQPPRNSCPHCRKPVLDMPDWNEALERTSRFLRGEDIYTETLPLRGEELFRNFCEELVKIIEDTDSCSVEDWVNDREPMISLVNLGTFASFADMIRSTPDPTTWDGPRSWQWNLGRSWIHMENAKVQRILLYRLEQGFPDLESLQLLMQHVAKLDTYQGVLISTNAATARRLANWSERIARSADKLRHRVYGRS